MNLEHDVIHLYNRQLKEWGLLKENIGKLSAIKTRELKFLNTTITLQYNPARIVSSGAAVDVKTIAQRPCFLCKTNRPKEQCGVKHIGYEVLSNPFPVFPQHFTIVSEKHEPQQIKENLGDLIEFALSMPSFDHFYNGPQCGASAPDHLHFQAVPKGYLPIVSELINQYGERSDWDKLWIEKKEYLRTVNVFRSNDLVWLKRSFHELYDELAKLQPERPEPLMNIVVSKQDELLWLFVFPRRAHRPNCYFESDSQRMIISPGTIDFCGTWVISRETDFERINETTIREVYNELTL